MADLARTAIENEQKLQQQLILEDKDFVVDWVSFHIMKSDLSIMITISINFCLKRSFIIWYIVIAHAVTIFNIVDIDFLGCQCISYS